MSSDYLFAKPSFIHGMARSFDLWGALDPYNWSPNGAAADALAMAVDWSVVGQDLAAAMNVFATEVEEQDQRQLRLIFPATTD